ncbi:MAG: diadenylate cyclase CdaA [Lachnospiraceae bacterium]|nr:diadenylate cyclase CdaA [Lachnospiraceae bacterium]
MLQYIQAFLNNYLPDLHMPRVRVIDVVEILILSFVLYQLLVRVRHTRIWSLLKGVAVIVAFYMFAVLFEMTTIMWIVERLFSIAVIALVVVFQPELRKVLEGLGRRSYFSGLFSFDTRTDGRFSDKTINEIARASFEMAKVRTGALIVIERNDSLADYELTGIEVDARVTSQLLINIFEHNTPLHDGAVIVRGDRVTSATCYLPLSSNMNLDKDLGTRHRAGVGVSEATDSLTIIVSEETGKISVAQGGRLERAVDIDRLKELMHEVQEKPEDVPKKRSLWKGVKAV